MNESQANKILDKLDQVLGLLDRILHKAGYKHEEPVKLTEGAVVIPLDQRPRAKRYPLREDKGTVFRSRPGYNWVCPYCNKAIMEGDMIIAFEPKPNARTTYAHLECDEAERKLWE